MLLPPVPPLPPGCPWSDWLPPNIKWCEENLCGWITTPANTWSNLAYLLIAVLIWHRGRSRAIVGTAGDVPPSAGSSLLVSFAPLCAFLGAASFAFHASYTLFFQFFDYLGMFLVLALLIVLNLERAGDVSPDRSRPWFAALVTALCSSVPLLYWQRLPYQLLIPLLALVVIGQELRLWLKGRSPSSYGWFVAATVSIAVAAAFTLSDLTRFWCDPTNHWLQGHSLWHLFSALSLYFAYRFFEVVRRPA